MKTTLLAAVIAASLAVGMAQAAEPATKPTTAQQQAAQAEIDKLVERIEVLSKQLGEDTNVNVIIRRGPGPMHGAMGDGPHWMERDGDGAHKQIRIERVGPGSDGDEDIRIMRMPGGMDSAAHGAGLGIVLAPNPAAAGVRVAAVTPDSPAMKAGLISNDVLLSIDGKPIPGKGAEAVEKVRESLGGLKIGQVVKLGYARQGKTYVASVTADSIRKVMMVNREFNGPMGDMPGMDDEGGMHRRHMMMMPADVEMDIERMGPMHKCPADEVDCGMPALFQAFRWQGLNLASIDASLGRYFGTDKGVLVISNGPELKGLQSGDVVQRVAGAEVNSPRDVMRVLRDKESGAQLQFNLLRDRKPVAVTVTVPKSEPMRFMAPPAPPHPPAPPKPPRPPAAVPPPPPPPPPHS